MKLRSSIFAMGRYEKLQNASQNPPILLTDIMQFPVSLTGCGVKLSTTVLLPMPNRCTRSSRLSLPDLYPMTHGLRYVRSTVMACTAQRDSTFTNANFRWAYLRQLQIKTCVASSISPGNIYPRTRFSLLYALIRSYELLSTCKRVHWWKSRLKFLSWRRILA